MKPRITEHAPPLCDLCVLCGRKLNHWIAAEFTSTTFATKVTAPNGIELLDKRFDKCWVVSQNTILKIALFLGLRSHSSAGEIRRTEIHLYTINNDTLEMYSQTEHSFHRRPERRIAVEVVPPVRLGLLRPLRDSFTSLIRPT